jgi:HSP20 family protein
MTEITVPVNIYRGLRRLMVATRLPGLEPQNIRLEVDGGRFSIRSVLRGVGQEQRPGYLTHEWMVGPYRREIELPEPVDATRANATYDNGVLVVMFPRTAQTVSGTITMAKVGTAKGRCRRHVGKDLLPVS